MKTSLSIISLLFLFTLSSAQAAKYRWFEADNNQTLVQKKTQWMKDQYEKKVKYFEQINFEPLKQKLFEPFHKDVPLKQLKLRNGKILSLYLEAGTIQQKLKLDDEVIFDESKLEKNVENFSSFSVDPLQKYLVIPVYRNGSTDEYNLYVLDLETKKVLKKFERAGTYGYFWSKPHQFNFILGGGLERFFMSYDFENGSLSFDAPEVTANSDNSFFTRFGNEQVGDEWKNYVSVRAFGQDSEHRLWLEEKWVGLKSKTDTFLIFESYDSFDPIVALLPYRYEFGNHVSYGEVKWHTLDSRGSITARFHSKGYALFETLFGPEIKYHLFSPSGELLEVLKAPVTGSLASFHLQDAETLKLTFRSPVKSKLEIDYKFKGKNWDPAPIDQALMFDDAGTEFKTAYFGVPTTDNLQVPVRIVYKADTPLDQTAKLFLEAYGGHGGIANFKPGFSRSTYLFLKAGGVHITPAVRGGGEYGRGWHAAGQLLNKLNTYIDIEKTVEFLHSQNIGTPETTALMGWSSGGMMSAAVMTRRPDLFKLVIPGNGLTDLLRKEILDVRFDRGWSHEYGGHHIPEEVAFLKSYSPLIFAQKERAYPTVYAVVGDGDSRVNPIHSYKFVAALQDHQIGENPILLGQAFNCGHWPNSSAYMGLKGFYVNFELYGVLFHELGLDPTNILKSNFEGIIGDQNKAFGATLYEELSLRQNLYQKTFFPKVAPKL